jgi:Rod binding domain-containing protein
MVHLASLQTPQTQDHAPVTPSPQLRRAAEEFEADFLQELLKPMKQDPLFTGDGNGDGEAAGSLGTIDGIGSQALAEALAKAGGLGIARQVLAKMAPIEAANQAARAAAASRPAAATAGEKKCGGCAAPLRIGTDIETEDTTGATQTGTAQQTGDGSKLGPLPVAAPWQGDLVQDGAIRDKIRY